MIIISQVSELVSVYMAQSCPWSSKIIDKKLIQIVELSNFVTTLSFVDCKPFFAVVKIESVLVILDQSSKNYFLAESEDSIILS